MAGRAERLLLEALLARVQAVGLLRARGRQRTDSTHVLAAVRGLNRPERVGETLRAALNALAVVAPEWLRAQAPAEWYERSGRRVENYNLPKSEAGRRDLATLIGADGERLLAAIEEATAADRSITITEHAVLIAGGGPTGMMLAGELALAGVDVVIVERRPSQDLLGSRAGGLPAVTIEMLDQRGIADRFLTQGQVAQVAGFAWIRLDISDFPTRHNYGLGLWQEHIERILAGWVDELAVPIYRGRDVTGGAQDDSGVDVQLSYGQSLRAEYLVGCGGGRSRIRKAAGIEFPGGDRTTSNLIAEVELAEEPEWGLRRDALEIHSFEQDGGWGSGETLRQS